MVFPSRELSAVFDIQIDLKIKHSLHIFGSQFRSIFRMLSNIQDGGFEEIVNGFWFLNIFAETLS